MYNNPPINTKGEIPNINDRIKPNKKMNIKEFKPILVNRESREVA